MRFGSFAAFVMLAGAGAAGWYWLTHSAAPPPANPGDRRSALRAGGGPVPVTVETVTKTDVPVYREGIGNVQALNNVTVRAQIDGRLSSLAFTEGQDVKKGDVLARIDPVIYQAQYDQAVAKKAQDEATLANARIDLQRYRNLAKENAGPQQQADQQAALVAQLEAQVKADQAAIDSAKGYLDYTVIRSPLDARAGLSQVDPGNIVHAADATGIVTLMQIKPINTVFTLPQRDLQDVIKALARGHVEVDALETGGRETLSRGRLDAVDNQIDMTTGTFKLKAVFDNDDQKLWPGQFVSVRVVIDTLKDALTVNATAIRRGPNGTFVYRIQDGGKAVVQNVEIVQQDETRAVVGKGVDADAQVVTVGFAQLTDGKAVTIAGALPAVPATAAPAAGEAGARNGSDEHRHRREQTSEDVADRGKPAAQ
jgi:membrane fusion protein, multidrug efflux system